MLVLNQQSAFPEGQQRVVSRGHSAVQVTVWLAEHVSLSPVEQPGGLAEHPLHGCWVLCPICWSISVEQAAQHPLSSLSKNVLTAERRAEENILLPFLSYSQRPHNVPEEVGWSSHGCSVPESLNCTGGQQERGMKRTFVPGSYWHFLFSFSLMQFPKDLWKRPAFMFHCSWELLWKGIFSSCSRLSSRTSLIVFRDLL